MKCPGFLVCIKILNMATLGGPVQIIELIEMEVE